jgi:hypothetical protein
MKRLKTFEGGLHTDALVAGPRYVEHVRGLVSTGTKKTIISSDLAARVADQPGPRACTTTLLFGKICGVSTKVAVALPDCTAADVSAIVVPAPRGHDLVIGRDVLRRSGVSEIDFSVTPTAIRCRPQRVPS